MDSLQISEAKVNLLATYVFKDLFTDVSILLYEVGLTLGITPKLWIGVISLGADNL